jgi:ubiquinone/menaquinone biosynthesis C-methylase UbiE
VTTARSYLPAAGRDAFLPLYDVFTRLLGFQKVLRALLDQAALAPRHLVLDVGCGTGTLAVLIKRLYPAVEVTGLDPDPRALARAAAKASAAGVAIRFDRGFGDALPYPDASFDRVFSSMMFHHLHKEDKPKVLAEIRRVLKPAGALEFLDFAGARPHSFLAQVLHGHQPLSPAGEERMLERFRGAGFVDPRKTYERGTAFGRIAFYEALAPAAG